MVTRYSFSPSFSVLDVQPLLAASLPRFCTAVSLSTSVSTVPAPPSSCIAFCVFTTGMGQASPMALTLIVISIAPLMGLHPLFLSNYNRFRAK